MLLGCRSSSGLRLRTANCSQAKSRSEMVCVLPERAFNFAADQPSVGGATSFLGLNSTNSHWRFWTEVGNKWGRVTPTSYMKATPTNLVQSRYKLGTGSDMAKVDTLGKETTRPDNALPHDPMRRIITDEERIPTTEPTYPCHKFWLRQCQDQRSCGKIHMTYTNAQRSNDEICTEAGCRGRCSKPFHAEYMPESEVMNARRRESRNPGKRRREEDGRSPNRYQPRQYGRGYGRGSYRGRGAFRCWGRGRGRGAYGGYPRGFGWPPRNFGYWNQYQPPHQPSYPQPPQPRGQGPRPRGQRRATVNSIEALNQLGTALQGLADGEWQLSEVGGITNKTNTPALRTKSGEEPKITESLKIPIRLETRKNAKLETKANVDADSPYNLVSTDWYEKNRENFKYKIWPPTVDLQACQGAKLQVPFEIRTHIYIYSKTNGTNHMER